MLIGVHSTVLGPAMGGTRLKPYDSPEDALRDALRLSGAMTAKQAVAGLPYGGGKAVLAVSAVPAPGSPERRELLLRHADFVESLHGTYVTAADMNTGEADMDVMGERTKHVLGRSVAGGGSGDPATGTALGVFHGIAGACRQAFGSPDVAGRTVLIQGVGAVGDRLADHLHAAGAALILADTHPERAEAAASRTGASVVAVRDVIGTPCDVYAPCATGAVLSAETIPALRSRVVAGAANNQLATPEDAARVEAAGIVYAPDYVVNGGGVIWLAGYEALGWDDAQMRARLAGIEQTVTQVFAEAEREGTTAAQAADRMAAARIAAAS
jgi:glutamate dehydrogenase/leucine dehydrogenase